MSVLCGLLVVASPAHAAPVEAQLSPVLILWMPCPAHASQHRLVVRFTLGDTTPAFIELADVALRTFGRWPAPAGVVGPQEMDIGRDITLRPGLYLVRLTQGTRSLTSTVVVRP
jgi:hypothetical protein